MSSSILIARAERKRAKMERAIVEQRARDLDTLNEQYAMGHVDDRDNWRVHYDSLRLYTPAKYCRGPSSSLVRRNSSDQALPLYVSS